ncbi:hypothetical protein LEMLEM_LOCUS16589 [Lemmus lemmus]
MALDIQLGNGIEGPICPTLEAFHEIMEGVSGVGD